MTSIVKPRIDKHLRRNQLGLTVRDYEGVMSTLCAGCGHDSVTAAFVQERRGHVGIEAFAELLSPAANRIRLALVDIFSFAFCAFFAWKSWTLFHEAWVDGQVTSSTWAPPLWIPYSLMAAGMTLLSLQIALQIAIAFAGKRS